MNYTEQNNIPGLLLLIDFEKAFDSLSWSFINKAMKYLNFGESLIHWIETFYKNITSAVIQCGHLSVFFRIGRGCRQGDPLSPYLFIICAEFLSSVIRQSKKKLKAFLAHLSMKCLVLRVSYCDQSMSVVRHLSCGVNNCFKSILLLHPWAN